MPPGGMCGALLRLRRANFRQVDAVQGRAEAVDAGNSRRPLGWSANNRSNSSAFARIHQGCEGVVDGLVGLRPRCDEKDGIGHITPAQKWVYKPNAQRGKGRRPVSHFLRRHVGLVRLFRPGVLAKVSAAHQPTMK